MFFCFYQDALVDEERISGHLLELLVREVRLTVRNKITHVVLPTHTHTHTGKGTDDGPLLSMCRCICACLWRTM